MNDPFEQFILAHGEELLRLAYTYTNDVQKSEEIVQHVFYKTYPKHQKYETKSSVKVFLYHAVLKRTNQSFKDFTSRLNTISKDKLPAASISSEAMLAEQVLMLPIKLREVIVFYYDFGFTQDYMATLLKLPISTVNSRLVQARKLLEENGFPETSLSKLKQSLYAAAQQEKFMTLSLAEKIVFERPSKKQRYIKISMIATASILLLSGAYFTPKAIGHFKQFNETIFIDELDNQVFAQKVTEYLNAIKTKDREKILALSQYYYYDPLNNDEQVINEQLEQLYKQYEKVDFKSFTILNEANSDFNNEYMPTYVHYTYKIKGDDTTYLQLIYGVETHENWLIGSIFVDENIIYTPPELPATISLEYYDESYHYTYEATSSVMSSEDMVHPIIVDEQLQFSFKRIDNYQLSFIASFEDKHYVIRDFSLNDDFLQFSPSKRYTVDTIENANGNPFYVISQNMEPLFIIYFKRDAVEFQPIFAYGDEQFSIYDVNNDGLFEILLESDSFYSQSSLYTIIEDSLFHSYGLEMHTDPHFFPMISSSFTKDGIVFAYKDKYMEKKWTYQFSTIKELSLIE